MHFETRKLFRENYLIVTRNLFREKLLRRTMKFISITISLQKNNFLIIIKIFFKFEIRIEYIRILIIRKNHEKITFVIGFTDFSLVWLQ